MTELDSVKRRQLDSKGLDREAKDRLMREYVDLIYEVSKSPSSFSEFEIRETYVEIT